MTNGIVGLKRLLFSQEAFLDILGQMNDLIYDNSVAPQETVNLSSVKQGSRSCGWI